MQIKQTEPWRGRLCQSNPTSQWDSQAEEPNLLPKPGEEGAGPRGGRSCTRAHSTSVAEPGYKDSRPSLSGCQPGKAAQPFHPLCAWCWWRGDCWERKLIFRRSVQAQTLGAEPVGSRILKADLSEAIPRRTEVFTVASQAWGSGSCTCGLAEPLCGPVRFSIFPERKLRPQDSKSSAHTSLLPPPPPAPHPVGTGGGRGLAEGP